MSSSISTLVAGIAPHPIYAVVADAEDSAAKLVAQYADAVCPMPFDEQSDRRTEILGNLFDALDQVEPNLGTRLYKAMFPFAADDPEGYFEPAKAQAPALLPRAGGLPS